MPIAQKKYMNDERAQELINEIKSRNPATFVGTKAEWNALPADKKAKYTLVNLTDDGESLGIDPVDAVEDGNMNAVTSNAVYDEYHQTKSYMDNYFVLTEKDAAQYEKEMAGLAKLDTNTRVSRMAYRGQYSGVTRAVATKIGSAPDSANIYRIVIRVRSGQVAGPGGLLTLIGSRGDVITIQLSEWFNGTGANKKSFGRNAIWHIKDKCTDNGSLIYSGDFTFVPRSLKVDGVTGNGAASGVDEFYVYIKTFEAGMFVATLSCPFFINPTKGSNAASGGASIGIDDFVNLIIQTTDAAKTAYNDTTNQYLVNVPMLNIDSNESYDFTLSAADYANGINSVYKITDWAYRNYYWYDNRHSFLSGAIYTTDPDYPVNTYVAEYNWKPKANGSIDDEFGGTIRIEFMTPVTFSGQSKRIFFAMLGGDSSSHYIGNDSYTY